MIYIYWTWNENLSWFYFFLFNILDMSCWNSASERPFIFEDKELTHEFLLSGKLTFCITFIIVFTSISGLGVFGNCTLSFQSYFQIKKIRYCKWWLSSCIGSSLGLGGSSKALVNNCWTWYGALADGFLLSVNLVEKLDSPDCTVQLVVVVLESGWGIVGSWPFGSDGIWE